jgi:hypothetical protein
MFSLPIGLNFILLTLVIVASLVAILQASRDKITNSARWIPISLGLILFTLIATLVVPSTAGYVSAALWILLAIVPSIGFRLSNHYFYRGSYRRAYRLKAWLTWLHPLADWPWQSAIFQAYCALHDGDRTLIKQLETAPTIEARAERQLFAYALNHQWEPLLNWWSNHATATALLSPTGIGRYFLWALGETGRLNELVANVVALQENATPLPAMFDYAQLYLFAFGGKVAETQLLIESRLRDRVNPEIALLWLATAHYAADHPERGRALLRTLQQATHDGVVHYMLEERLRRPILPARQLLSHEAAQALDKQATEWQERMRLLAQWS